MAEFKETTVENLKAIRRQEFDNKLGAKYLTKKHARFITVTRLGISCRRYDIAILTSDMEFYDFSMMFGQKTTNINQTQYNKILNIFRCFIIDDQTEIVILNTANKFCPLVIYLYIIKPYAKFKLHYIGMPKVVGRIFNYRRKFGLTKYTTSNQWASRCIHKIWRKLVESRECPFITKTIDDQLSLMDKLKASHHIRSRVFMYYMLVRRISNRNKPKQQKQIKNEESKIEEILT